jgi:hypothetical protein
MIAYYTASLVVFYLTTSDNTSQELFTSPTRQLLAKPCLPTAQSLRFKAICSLTATVGIAQKNPSIVPWHRNRSEQYQIVAVYQFRHTVIAENAGYFGRLTA